MYNRYMNRNGYDSSPIPEPKPNTSDQTEDKRNSQPASSAPPPSMLGGAFKNLFGGNFRLPELNSDTLLLLVLVYFLVADKENDNINDTILIIAALFLLGL
ncbi:MAG: hypothetical protein IJF53_02965 [Clostridia bacterium]|nr:hypothetical protein [Clostridia bacterium]